MATQAEVQQQVYDMMGGDAAYAERLQEQYREMEQYRRIQEEHERRRQAEMRQQQEELFIYQGVAQAPPSPRIMDRQRNLIEEYLNKIFSGKADSYLKPKRTIVKSFNELLKERIK